MNDDSKQKSDTQHFLCLLYQYLKANATFFALGVALHGNTFDKKVTFEMHVACCAKLFLMTSLFLVTWLDLTEQIVMFYNYYCCNTSTRDLA